MNIINGLRTNTSKIGRKKAFFIVPFMIIILLTLIVITVRKPEYVLKTKIRVGDTFGINPSDTEMVAKAMGELELLDAENPAASISSVKQKISAKKDPASSLMEISATGKKSVETAKILNKLTDLYVYEVNSKLNKMQEEDIAKKEVEMNEYKKNLREEMLAAKKRLEDCERRLEEMQAIEGKSSGLLSSFESQLAELEFQRANLLKTYTSAYPEVVKLDSEIGELKEKISSIPRESTGKLKFERELKDSQNIYNALKEKWDEASLKKIEDLKEPKKSGATATIVSYTQAAATPSEILWRKRTILLIGIVMAILISLLSVLVAVFLDASIVTQEELYAYTNLQVIGEVPYIKPVLLKDMKIGKKSSLILGCEGDSGIIEPYRLIYAYMHSNIFEGQPSGGKSIFLTSSIPGEGKSTIASNLALIMAKAGKNVLLIDANLSNPSIHSLFGMVSRVPGFTDLLNKGVGADTAVRDLTDMLLGGLGLETAIKFKGLDRLKIITAGSPVSDLSELIISPETNSVIAELKTRFDYIILDGPSISTSIDSLTLASKCDATIMVYLAGKTPRQRIRSALLKLGSVRPEGSSRNATNIKGAILNKCI
ncbi:MAG: AAA family ATPase [Candidatus Omnitrophica bacterium]|nr:AAA family ATPase [Candidatus Omnitrophota bacterium]